MTRYTDQGRDLSKPLIDARESASWLERIGVRLLRGYILIGVLLAVLAGISIVLLLLAD